MGGSSTSCMIDEETNNPMLGNGRHTAQVYAWLILRRCSYGAWRFILKIAVPLNLVRDRFCLSIQLTLITLNQIFSLPICCVEEATRGLVLLAPLEFQDCLILQYWCDTKNYVWNRDLCTVLCTRFSSLIVNMLDPKVSKVSRSVRWQSQCAAGARIFLRATRRGK